jgi:DNA topoisomerase-2
MTHFFFIFKNENYIHYTTVSSMADVEKKQPTRKHGVMSQKEHMREKSMWTGGKTPVKVSMMLMNHKTNQFETTDVTYTPAWYKLVDEIIVNAVDHLVKTQKVTEIQINYNVETGEINVKNDGKGIPIHKVHIIKYENNKLEIIKEFEKVPKKATIEKTMHLPQLLFEHPNSGDNLDQTPDQITGGMNGVGAKLVNYLSTHFKITTVYKGKRYSQVFEDGSEIIHEPVIEDYDKASYTKVSFIPNFEKLNVENTEANHKILCEVVRSRAYQCAAFTGVDVYFNGDLIEVNNLLEYAKLHVLPLDLTPAESKLIHGTSTEDNVKSGNLLKKKDYILTKDRKLKYPMIYFSLESEDGVFSPYVWDVVISASDGDFQHISLINGIFVKNGGHHIDYIKKTLLTYLKQKLDSEYPDLNVTPKTITNNLFIFMRANIPGVDFDSQVKEKLVKPVDFSSYKFNKELLTKIWKLLQEYLVCDLLAKTKETSKRPSKEKLNMEKLIEAYAAGKPGESYKCNLWVAEGDSATGPIVCAIRAPKSTMPPKYNGIFTTGGKIMNARKETIVHIHPKTKVCTKYRSKAFKDNIRLSQLQEILGLDYNKSYNTNHEFETLRYGCVIGATDQDTDGDHIFCLLMNFIATWWPALIKRGYLKKIRTALVIMRPKAKGGESYEFFSMKSFKESNLDLTKYKDPEYSKGLGSNMKDYITHIFNNLENYLTTIIYDAKAEEYLEMYYGDNADVRKIELKTDIEVPEPEGLDVACSDFIRVYGKMFQKYDQFRHLPNNIDGFNSSSRKIIYGALKLFSSDNGFRAISNVSGNIKVLTDYHHGEKSMEDSIIRLAQEKCNFGLEIPFFLQEGMFGNYGNGGHDHASSRYIKVKLNPAAKLLFPGEDAFALEFNYENGKKLEPKCYVPIFPMSIFMWNSQPSTGYTNTTYPIDFDCLYRNVMISIKGKKSLNPFEFNTFKWKGEIICENPPDEKQTESVEFMEKYKPLYWSVGKYKYIESKNMIHVTELPLYIYEAQYVRLIRNLDANVIKTGKVKKGTEHDIDVDAAIKAAKTKKTKKEDKKKLVGKFIDDIETETSNEAGVSIKIYLKPDSYEKIQKTYKTTLFDGITEYFILRKRIINKLNFIDINGTVQSYNKYEPIFMEWFNLRKQIYIDRYDRYLILLGIEILILQNLIRFCDNITVYGIDSKTPEAKMHQILNDEKYDKFDMKLYNSNTEIKNVNLVRDIVNSETATHDYIIDLKIRDTNKERNEERKAKLAELMKEKAVLELPQEYFKGAGAWIAELNKLKDLYAKKKDLWNDPPKTTYKIKKAKPKK